MSVFNIADLQAEAKAMADSYGIGTLGTRGNGDARDAFRHAYVSAKLKAFFSQGYDDIDATALTVAAGMIVELGNGGNYNSSQFGDYNQDLWNDHRGAEYDVSSGLTPAQYVKNLYDNNKLILTNVESEQESRVAYDPSSYFLQAVGKVKDGWSWFNNTISDAVGDLFRFVSGDPEDAAKSLGGIISGDVGVAVLRGDSEEILSVFAKSTTLTAGGKSYLLTDVLDSLSDAAEATAEFIKDLAQAGTAWFTQGGVQDAFASWLSQNIDAIISGDLSGSEALISLGRYFAGSFLSNYIVNDTLSAQTAITKVLYEQFGVGENPFDANGNIIDLKADSVVYAGDIAAGLTTIAATFITNGFDAEKALNAGVAIVAGRVAATFLTKNGYVGKGYSGEVTTAVATVVAGLLNDFSGDWAQLGIQVGIAVTIYSVTQGVTTALAATQVGAALQSFPILGVDPLTIVTGLIVSFIASKIISSIYKGVVFHEGEFGDPQQLLNSIYQIQPIVVNGQTVNALVAVHPQGSTIIAQNIAYILGGAGSDVLVGNDSAGTISASGGADYLEARGGNDVLLGGDGNDHLNGGEGDDILQGDAGDDNLFGEAGNDTIIGEKLPAWMIAASSTQNSPIGCN